MNRIIKNCSECESDYFQNSSKMPGLCPDCSNKLYNHKNCEHKFENGRCIKCYWNGKTSEFLTKKK